MLPQDLIKTQNINFKKSNTHKNGEFYFTSFVQNHKFQKWCKLSE